MRAAAREHAASPGGPGSVLDPLQRNVALSPRRIALLRRHFSRWEPVSYADFQDQARQVAKGLAASGIQPGDRVAVMSGNRFEWTVADFAIWYAGAVPVAVWEHSSAEELEWALSESGAAGVFLGSPRERDLFASIAERVPNVSRSWSLARSSLDRLAEIGQVVGDDDLDARSLASRGDSLAAIQYTSGTSGRPKPCMLTHRNLGCGVEIMIRTLPLRFTPQDSTLLVVSQAHLLGRLVQLSCLATGAQLGHSSGPDRLADDLAGFRPTFLFAPPQVLDEIVSTARKAAAQGGRRRIFGLAQSTAVAYSRAAEGPGPGLAVRARHAALDRPVYRDVRALLGGAEVVVAAGSALTSETRHFLRGSGIDVRQQYGTTEAGAFIEITGTAEAAKAVPGAAEAGPMLRIAADGEILLKGPSVFAGYFNDPATTSEVLPEDGWLHTHDLGRLDAEGRLRIIGRKGDLLRTAPGAAIMPGALEDRLRACPLVAQCLVAGADPLVALMTLEQRGLASMGTPVADPDISAVAGPSVLDVIRAFVDEVNHGLPKVERIERFTVLPVEWTQASGHVGPSGALRRRLVLKEHAADIAALLG
jgi:long-chain acyl-CoA synthetase